MNIHEQTIFTLLRRNPGMLYVEPDTNKLYCLAGERLMVMSGDDFLHMSDDELRETHQKLLAK